MSEEKPEEDPKPNKEDPKPSDDSKKTEEEKGKPNDTTDDELTDEQWKKAFGHDRFKNLASKGQKYDELIKANEKAATAKLKEDGKLKELADVETKRANAAEAKLATNARKNAIASAATKAGVIDPQAAALLIPKSKVETGEDGEVTNADQLVADLIKDKPYLKGKKGNLGAGGSGDGDNPDDEKGKTWSQSEIRKKSADPIKGMEWWEKNKKEIFAAQAEGRIKFD